MKNNKGFSLVELIVVIAIMAILAAVAVIGVSVYIPKAQQASDKQMVADIEYVLNLHAQSTPEEVTAGYIILTPNGPATASDGFVTEVLVATYGDDWENELKLAYGEWTNDGLLQYVVTNADSAGLIAGSTYLTTASTDGLMNAVTNLTDASSMVIQNYMEKYKDDPAKVEEKLSSLLGEEFVTDLNNTGVKNTDPEYTTVISNMLVGQFAGNMKDLTVESAMEDQLIGMTLTYAELYAYCEMKNDTTTMAALNEYLSKVDEMDDLSSEKILNHVTEITDDDFMSGFDEFEGAGLDDPTEGQGYKDISAALEIMGAVDMIAGTYTDKESLSDPNLYASDSVSEQLNNYISAINAVASGLDLPEIGENDIVVFVADDGAVSVLPRAASLAQ